MDIKVEHMDWGNKSNKKIKEELESLKHGHIALKNKIDTRMFCKFALYFFFKKG